MGSTGSSSQAIATLEGLHDHVKTLEQEFRELRGCPDSTKQRLQHRAEGMGKAWSR
jgi:hypothetical protein